jgi:hypothetical protein
MAHSVTTAHVYVGGGGTTFCADVGSGSGGTDGGRGLAGRSSRKSVPSM